MPREHGDDGSFVETVTLDAVLDVFEDVEGPVVLSADVADALDCSRETARRKLEQLYEGGELDRRKVSRRVVYWRPEPPAGSPAERADDVLAAEPVETPTEPPERDEHAASDDGGERASTRRETADSIDDVVDSVGTHWGDRPQRVDERKAAARAVLEYAREHGDVSKLEAINEIEPDHSVEGQNPETWYRNNVRPVLREACEYDSATRSYHFALDDQGDDVEDAGGVYDPTEEF